MKKIFTLILSGLLALGMTIHAIDITKVDRVEPTDEMFMDMATTAARQSISSGGPASGAVIILNGAWRSTGTPGDGRTAEQNAYMRSRLDQLNQANIYTINEPTTEIVNFLNSLHVNAIYFVNGRDAVVAAGIYPASAYDDSKLDKSGYMAKMWQLTFPEAVELLGK